MMDHLSRWAEEYLLLGILIVTFLTWLWNRRAAFSQEASGYMQNVAKYWSDRPGVVEVKDVTIRNTQSIPFPGGHRIAAGGLEFKVRGLKPVKHFYPIHASIFQINLELLCGLYNNSRLIGGKRRVGKFLNLYITIPLMYFKNLPEFVSESFIQTVGCHDEYSTEIQKFIEGQPNGDELLKIWEEIKIKGRFLGEEDEKEKEERWRGLLGRL